eukprot:11411257-Ditylum_brightwellii.AAC.1
MLVNGSIQYGGPFNNIIYEVSIGKSKIKQTDALQCKSRQQHCQSNYNGGEEEEKGMIHVMVDHPSQVDELENCVVATSSSANDDDDNSFSVFLKIDTGCHRVGVPCDDES